MPDDLFSTPGLPPINLIPRDGVLHDLGTMLTAREADAAFQALQAEAAWEHDTLRMQGRIVVTRREIAWHGDPGMVYRYSGRPHAAAPWTPTLQHLRDEVSLLTGSTFNSCLLNLYHDGREGMGWHSDDEPELGPLPCIASLSLGATRRFRFRHRSMPHTCELLLHHGQLIVMAGTLQRHWQHALPPMTGIREPRINLTFRTITLPPSAR